MLELALPKRIMAVSLCAVLAIGTCGLVPLEAQATSVPSKTSISKVQKASKSFTVKWKKNSSKAVSGYQIRYSTKKSMKSGVKTVKVGKSATSKKIKSGVKAATTYYVQIRVAYKVSGKTKYTGWSAKKSVTTMVGSGNSTFDKKIESILSKKVKKTGTAGLKRAFNYVADMPQGNTTTAKLTGAWKKWSVTYAKAMVSKQRGNCYQAGALMAWLAKGLGYEARACTGTYTGGSGKVSPHGWAEVKIGGKWYIFDANNQNTANKANLSVSYYKVSKTSETGKKYSE